MVAPSHTFDHRGRFGLLSISPRISRASTSCKDSPSTHDLYHELLKKLQMSCPESPSPCLPGPRAAPPLAPPPCW